MRRLILILILATPSLFGYSAYSGWCEQGGVRVVVAGQNSPLYFQQSYPNFTQAGSGPHVTVYQPGTTTKLTLYSDNAGTPLANPFPCSATGQYLFYSPANIADLLFSGTGISSFTRASIGGSTQQVSVTDFGALCAGTSHDDAPAITAAIASLATSGGLVNFPSGICRINSTVYVPNNGIRLVGTGSGSAASPPGASVIDCRSATLCVAFTNSSDPTGAAGVIQNIGMENLTISITNNTHTNFNTLAIINADVNSSFTNVRVEDYGMFNAGAGRVGIDVDSGSGVSGSGFIAGLVFTNVSVYGVFNIGVSTGSTLFGVTQWMWNGGQIVSTTTPGGHNTFGMFFRRVAGAQINNVDVEGWDTGVSGDTTTQNQLNLRLEGNTLDYNFSVSACSNVLMGSYFTITETTAFCNSRAMLNNITSGLQEWLLANDTNFPSGSTQEFNGTITTNLVLAHIQGAFRNILLDGGAGNTGGFRVQAGPGGPGLGGAVIGYGHSSATHPGDVVAAISATSGGCFRVNSSGDDAGSNYLKACPTLLTISGDLNQILQTPASSSAACVTGSLAYDTGFIYVCTATNTWKRIAIATW